MPGSAEPAPVAVVVPTHDRGHRLRRLVAALEAQTRPPAEVVIVDDASTDATASHLAEVAASTTLPVLPITLDRPTGPAGARNRGWAMTRAPFVAFTDDDCIPSPEWLAEGVAALERSPRAGIVQGATVPQPGVAAGRWPATREVRAPTDFFEGCNLFLRREALEAAGGFDEGLGMGGEDTALGWGVLGAGWDRGFAAGALVVHDTTHPGLAWHLRQAWLQRHFVDLALRHPAFRATFWRSWAFRRREAAFAAAAMGAVLAPRHRAAVLLALPYAWLNRTSRPDAEWARSRVEVLAVDAVTVAGMMLRSLRRRRLIV